MVGMSEECGAIEFQRLSLIEPEVSEPTAYFAWEQSRGMLFLLDTGATLSILPCKIFKPDKACQNVIRGVTGNVMNVLGKTCVNLDFGFSTPFEHEFLIAQISDSYGILGCDFFAKQKLRLCASTLKLTHTPSNSQTVVYKTQGGARAARKLLLDLQGHSPKIMSNIFNSKALYNNVCQSEEVSSAEEMLWGMANCFPELFVEPSYHEPPKHGFVLDIELEDSWLSIYYKPRKAPAAEQKAIRDNFEKLEKQGVVVRCSSNFASPVTVVKKKMGILEFVLTTQNSIATLRV